MVCKVVLSLALHPIHDLTIEKYLSDATAHVDFSRYKSKFALHHQMLESKGLSMLLRIFIFIDIAPVSWLSVVYIAAAGGIV